MTGFAAAQIEFEGGRLSIDLRSVNSRFLDLSFRLPDELRQFEPMLREKIAKVVSRGKLECRLGLHLRSDELGSTPPPNEAALSRLKLWQSQVLATLPDAQPLTVAEVLRWPGVMAENEPEGASLSRALHQVFDSCLEQFLEAREREGHQLGQALLERCASIESRVNTLRPELPEILQGYQKRAIDRLTEMLQSSGPAHDSTTDKDDVSQRLATEIALYTLRADVEEELDRLGIHLEEVRRIVSKPMSEGIGKRLDFLMQELHREANTLGSKAMHRSVTNSALDIKLFIEQMREQVQNIE